ncbi:LacI family DNA-binding transcriptional regulator [Humibacter ginsengiterrae]
MARAGSGDVKPATINDVAAAAGVSRQTVTRAMNDLPDVSPATKRRVQEAAAALRYRPNRAAQRLVRGGDVTIGFVVGDLRNPYYPELATELTHRAAERDWGVVMTDVSGRRGTERVESIVGRVDAVVGHLARRHRDLVTSRVPTVLLSDDPVESGAGVRFEYASAMNDAVSHLVASGRQRIAMIDASHGPSLRYRLLVSALEDHGLSAQAVVPAADTHQGGVAAVAQLMERAPQVDAVLCFNDVLAVGALKGFALAGIRVPDDVAVIGVDGLDIGTLVTPELTTLALDTAELAAHAIDLVDAVLRGDTGERLHRSIAHTLLVRESA